MKSRCLYSLFPWIQILLFLVNTSQKLEARPRIKILTTIFPLMEFAREVAGEKGEASLFVPPGAEVHTWQPRISDIAKFSSLDLFIYIGRNLEPWVGDILKSIKNPRFRTLEASQNIVLIRGSGLLLNQNEEEAADPHVWLDFNNDIIIVDQIQKILSEIDPENADFFSQRAANYKKKLIKLSSQFEEALKDCRHRMFIFGGHSAFGYLAERYKLEQISLYGLSPDSEPTPKQILRVITLARKQGIKTVYFEANVNPKLARLIAREIGAQVLPLNPCHNLTKKQLMSGISFFDIMEENLNNLKDGLICR